MDILAPHIEAYLERFSSRPNEVLHSVLDKTNREHAHAHMASGAVQGKFLELICRLLNPRKVLEIGTFTGFSALCLAAGMPEDGILHTIELREEDAALARENIALSPLAKKIMMHVGDAKTIIPGLHEEWDLVFVDADKTGYIEYYELTLPQIKPGGFMLADNVLFHGQAVEENPSGKNAKAIHAFNEHVTADNRTEQVMLSVRDGLSLIRKL